MGTDVRIEVLGPVRAWRAGQRLELGPAGQRMVLGLLTLAGGQPLSRAEIISGIWRERQPPTTAANVIQTHVKHLRRALEPDRPARARSALLPRLGDGYALHLPDAAVDLSQFRQRMASAANAQRLARLDHAAEHLESALGLWQGAPLADIPALAGHPKVVALEAERQDAVARYGEVMIATGHAAEVLRVLEEAALAQPLDEAAQARLIQAYHAAGRRGQAFALYHQVRRRLADELGVAPGPELTAAHTALLHDDRPGAEPIVLTASRPVPAQLPADVPVFAGRAAELSELDRLLTASLPAPICAVSGTAGVGKTTLVVHWAHRVAHLFADGQLYVNLRGFDHSGRAMDAAEAMRCILDALDVPAERIPTNLEAQAALYRSRLSGRRMLIVLDNARDTAQVRPLLPGGPGCLALVTSRGQLSGLVAAEGAHALPLDPLAPHEARELLGRRIGTDRAAREPDAVADIVTRCAGLPLAVVIVAARATASRRLPLATLAGQMRGSRDRLDTLTTGDPNTDLRAVLSWSYRILPPDAARLFRLLGLHPGPTITTAAAASLAALPPSRLRRALAELVAANLVTEHAPGRYLLHDLLRAYAGDLAERLVSDRQRRAATRRMLDHYLHVAAEADRIINPVRHPIALPPPAAGVVLELPAGEREALVWFTEEHAVLVAVVDRAATVSSAHAWRLAWTMYVYLDRNGHWEDLVTTQRAAAAAARREAEPSAQADARRFLARAYTRLGRLDEAHAELRHALDLYGLASDRDGQGYTHLNLSLMWGRRARHGDALEHTQRAFDLFQATGDRAGQARAVNAMGWYHTLLGDHDQALVYCQQALDQLRRLDDRNGQANTWESLGHAHRHLGHHAESLTCYRSAVNLYHALGDRHLEAIVLSDLGDAHQAFGSPHAARAVWLEALAILDDVDPLEAEKVRARLAARSPDPVHIPS